MKNDASINPLGPRSAAFAYAFIFCAALLAMAWQFIFPGYYNISTIDAANAHKYIIQFMSSLKAGVIYPRWMPDNFGGYGTPAFVYYSPLLYFCSALLGLAGLSIPSAVTFLTLAGLFTGGLFLFLFAKKHFGERAALLAALIYILLPSRFLFLYSINTPAGRFGEAFMPMALYYMQRYMESGLRRRHLFWLAFSYAALILSHIATAYLFTPFLAIYGLIARAGGGPLRAAPKVILGLVSGILLSSFFFLPVLLERGLVQLSFLEREYQFAKFFIPNFPGITPQKNAMQVGALFKNIILTESVITAASLYSLVRRRKLSSDVWMKFMACGAVACLFMMSSLSYLVWEYVPGMRSVAFPSRFVPIYIIFVSVLIGTGLDGILRGNARAEVVAGLVASLLFVVFIYDALVVAKSIPPLSVEEVQRLTAHSEMPEYLPAAVSAQDLPVPRSDTPLVSSLDECSSVIENWGAIDRRFTVDSPRGARIRVKTFYFPGWRAWVDGKETRLWAQDRTGAILMDVPAGRREVRLMFTDTRPRTAGKIISILALVGLVFPYGWIRREGASH